MNKINCKKCQWYVITLPLDHSGMYEPDYINPNNPYYSQLLLAWQGAIKPTKKSAFRLGKHLNKVSGIPIGILNYQKTRKIIENTDKKIATIKPRAIFDDPKARFLNQT